MEQRAHKTKHTHAPQVRPRRIPIPPQRVFAARDQWGPSHLVIVLELNVQVHNVVGVGQSTVQSGVANVVRELLLDDVRVGDQEPVHTERGLQGTLSVNTPISRQTTRTAVTARAFKSTGQPQTAGQSAGHVVLRATVRGEQGARSAEAWHSWRQHGATSTATAHLLSGRVAR
jgi:hypothetical protein